MSSWWLDDHFSQVSTLPTMVGAYCVRTGAWLVFDTLICPHGQPDARWLEVTERFSERICLGSDIFGRFDALTQTLAKYTPFLDALSDSARRNLTLDTAKRLYDNPALSEPI